MIREPPWLEPWSWTGPEPLQPEHALAASGQPVGGGAAHAAQPDHDHVIGVRHVTSVVGCAVSVPQARHTRVEQRFLGHHGRTAAPK